MRPMPKELTHLEMKCRRAAHEVLALEWGPAAGKVRTAVQNLIVGPPHDCQALQFLIAESEKLPVQFEPARRLHDLVDAAAELHNHNLRAANFVRWAQGAA